jgi:hypothetical protein
MSKAIRTTRECSIDQLDPRLFHSLREYFHTHALGELSEHTFRCCETVTTHETMSALESWSTGNAEATNYLATLLTGNWFFWIRTISPTETVINAADLIAIHVDTMISSRTGEVEIKISGVLAGAKNQTNGKLILGPDPAAKIFTEALLEAAHIARPQVKRKFLPWLKLQ